MRVKHGVVVVEVSGGVVCASLISPGVRLIIVDHDNMDAYEVRGTLESARLTTLPTPFLILGVDLTSSERKAAPLAGAASLLLLPCGFLAPSRRRHGSGGVGRSRAP